MRINTFITMRRPFHPKQKKKNPKLCSYIVRFVVSKSRDAADIKRLIEGEYEKTSHVTS